MSDLQSKTRYDPQEVEPRVAQSWRESGIFHPEPVGSADENYSIALPPPNITGVLHMGHALNNAVQDTLIRHARQHGRRAKWILGTDHAGIATQTKVERALVSEGTSRKELGREQFVKRVWEWRERYGHQIIEQISRLGSSVDFSEERFTLDAGYAKAVLEVFVRLYRKGYIYRDRYLVNWDPGSGSAISDLEVENREFTDTLYYIDYPLASGSGALTIATVRPETMFADVAIAVNPDDERYSRLIGETAILPLVGRRLPIIADSYVKPEFGTGALKITPAHDVNDFDIGNRHGLPHPSVVGEDGLLVGDVPERYRGLTTAEAQEKVVADLREQGLISRTEAYTHMVPVSQRSGRRIEPLISLQWFMRMDELAKPAIQAVVDGHVRFHPERSAKVYLDWMENIRPWCISRQLWWGHQLPVYYRGEETYVGESAPEGEGWVRDNDVLDTWFSSALWPFVTLGWPQQTSELDAFYPTDVVCTGRDIIFLWVARMIMMGLEFTGEVPFSDVYINSIIQAPDGRRMSKSLGTGIDPRALLDGGPRPPVFAKRPGADPGEFPAYGADAVRWGLLAMASDQDVRFNEERVAQGAQLTNKLWNASRLILMGVEEDARAAARPSTVEDRWILSRLERARVTIDGAIRAFEFPRAALALYDFIYAELCDWYLELVKPRLHGGDEEDTQATLLYILTETIALAHPLIPFVTEEIYGHIPGVDGLLAARSTAAWADGAPAAWADGAPAAGGDAPAAGGDAPAAGGDARGSETGDPDLEAEAEVERLIAAVQALRTWRDGAGVKPSAILPACLRAQGYERTSQQLERLGRITLSVDGIDGAREADGASMSVPIAGGTLEILPSDDVDPGAADARREAKRAHLQAEIARAEGKLANAGFLAKAPAAVVQSEREKLQALRAELEAL